MKRMFSGIQPTGALHLGNYFGAVSQWIQHLTKYECIYSIVDYHAITTPYQPEQLRKNKLEVAVSLLSLGVDPEKCVLFFQSDVPEHTELSWILNSMTSIGALERMTQFKDKAEDLQGGANAGLFCYPILQAADILLYKTQCVPVGKDQAQHLELTREIARRFNHTFGDTFPEPETVLGTSPKIIGLDGKSKMSKSKDNAILLNDTPDQVQTRLKTAFTDPQRLRLKDPGRPEICNIWALHHLFQTQTRVDEIAKQCREASLGCGDCKKELGGKVSQWLEPYQSNYSKWISKSKSVFEILDDGGKRARKMATATMDEVRDKMGLRSSP